VGFDEYIILAVLIGGFVVIAFSYYTVRGSAINQRPRGGGRGDAQAGASGRSRVSRAETGGEDSPGDFEN